MEMTARVFNINEGHNRDMVQMLFGEWKLVVEREECIERGRVEIAKNALGEGVSVEFIQKITGLSTETIQSLANR